MSDVGELVLGLSPDIRYVALAAGQDVQMWSRPRQDASASDSDRFEELLVNPTLVTLAGQRGAIDCGGLRYLIVGYGNFDQLVIPLPHGHVSVAFDPGSDPAAYVERVLDMVAGT